MAVLGLSVHELGSAVALIADGAVGVAAREERFTRQRLDPNLPAFAARFALDRFGAPASALGGVVLAGDPAARFSRVLVGALGEGFPTGAPAFARALSAEIGHRVWQRDAASRLLDVDPAAIRVRPRHACLAAAAAGAAGEGPTAILVLDTVGEWAGSSLHRWAPPGLPEVVDTLEYPHSLGLVAAALAAFLGLRPWEGLGTLGELAAWGRPTLVSRLRRVVRLHDDGRYDVAPGYFRFAELAEAPHGEPWTGAFLDAFGAPRDPRRPWPFTAGRAPARVDTEDQRHADVAASWQVVLEEAVLGLARRAGALTGARRLALAGPLAGQPALVRRLRRDAGFDRVGVPVDPDGAALGAARLGEAEAHGALRPLAPAPYAGRAWSVGRDLDAVAAMDPVYWQRFRRRGVAPLRDVRVQVRRALGDAELAAAVVADLAAGRLVGWCEGAFESGPAALGHRAVLAAPAHAERLRERVTGAPAAAPDTLLTTADALPSLVDEPAPLDPLSPTAALASAAARAAAPTAVHADGTLRYLVVDPLSPRLAAVVRGWQAASGQPGLVHAELREADDPLASAPAEALLVWLRTELDTLVLDDGLVRKEFP